MGEGKIVKDFLIQEISQQRRSIFLWAPVAIGLGIVTYFQYGQDISWSVIAGAFFLILLAIRKSYRGYSNQASYGWLTWLLLSIAIFLSLIGFSLAQYRTQSLTIPVLEKDLKSQVIEGEIERLVMLDGGKAKRVILRDVKIDDQILRVRLKTYHFKGDQWRSGDHISVKAKLIAPGKSVIPGGFDFSFKAKYEGISAVGYTLADAKMIRKSMSDSNHIEQFRGHIGRILYDHMDARYAGIAQALLTGERSGISKNDTENLRASGLAHLLAISGLHIGLVAGCVFFFVRLFLAVIPALALRYPIKKYAAFCAIIIAFTYMVLAGATVPTVRAFIMTSLVLLAVILDRSAMNMRLVALAAIIVMITTPEAIMGPSFVLSFAAVSALIAFYQGAGRKWLVNANAYKPLYRPVYYFAGVIVTTIIATLATAPFSVMFFNRFAVYSVIANMAAMPIMAFIIMPFGLLSALLIPLGLDSHFWVIMEWGISQITIVAQSVSDYKGADLYLPSFDMHETILIACGFLWLVLWRGVLRFIGIGVIVIAMVLPQFNKVKSIMISEDMKAIMIVDRSVDNFFLIGKMNSYLKSNLLGSLGIDPTVDIPVYKGGDQIDKSMGYCDDLICDLNLDGINIAIILNPIAISKACENTDIVISNIPINEYKACQNVTVIDRFDVWRHGATTLTFDNGSYVIETVK